MEKQSSTHDLNIHKYSLDELLGLFELSYNISMNQLKIAKKKVLMLHPDKSRLPPEYFLFYKKAFDVIVQFYENNNKQNQKITEETTKYTLLEPNLNKSTIKNVMTVAGEMAPKDFQNKFNKLFEDNMVNKPDSNRNEWFSKDEPIYKASEQVSTKNMGEIFNTIKQNNAEIVQYRGVKEMQSSSGTRLYDNDENDEDEIYVTSDPFSKLKFDDLRKVHKDQTIFAVSENDFQKVPQYSSVDHFVRERSKQTLTPLEKNESEQLLAMQNKQYRERIMQKEHAANLQSMRYEEKNKSVMSSFLQLGN